MLGKEKLTLGRTELDEALDLAVDGGKKCHTLGELVEFVTRLVADDDVLRRLDPAGKYLPVEPHRWWFRGARSDRFELKAGLFRTVLGDVSYPTPTETYGRLEQRIQHEYSLMTRGRFPELSGDPWDRLFEMQHYGLPTRLLDWTYSLGQALWFALSPRDDQAGHGANARGERKAGASNEVPCTTDSSDRREDSGRPVIWMLNPRLLAKASLGAPSLDDFVFLERYGTDDEVQNWTPKPTRPGSPRPGWILDYLAGHPSMGHFPVLASWTNPRMAAQMGCFTLQGGLGGSNPRPLEEYAKSTGGSFLLKVCFEPDPQLLQKAYHALSMIGVNKYTLFPEVHETCAWIKELRHLRR